MQTTTSSGSRTILYSCPCTASGTNSVNYEIDVSKFRDPAGNKALTSTCQDGRDGRVQDWIATDPRMDAVLHSVLCIADDAKTTKASHVSIGFTDHHGQWASVALVELAAQHLRKEQYDVVIFHRVAGTRNASSCSAT